MTPKRKKRPGILAEHAADPLTFAVDARDNGVVRMVEDAIARNRVLLAYQPIVQAGHPDRAAFFEGLIRVLDATGRIIPAGQFFPAVEERESGRELDCLALKMGLNALRRHKRLRLSINMSARSIGYRRWSRTLARGLKADPTLAERLILEISESSAMTVPEHVTGFMSELQGKGIAFALDNFGGCRFALRHLRDFAFDILKIDGQFVRGIHDHPDNQVLVEALVALSRPFDMFTVAERVETRDEAQWLARAGVDCLQGFYFGAPATRPDWAAPGAQTGHKVA